MTKSMYRVNAHAYTRKLDVQWHAARSAHAAAEAYVSACSNAELRDLRTVHVVRTTAEERNGPVHAATTYIPNDGRIVTDPSGARRRIGLGESFDWIATSTNGIDGEMVPCTAPTTGTEHHRLAWGVLETARLYNDSFVAPTFDPGQLSFGHHTLSIADAAERVARDANEAHLINVMLFTAWNDVCDWATMTLENRTPHPGDARDGKFDTEAA